MHQDNTATPSYTRIQNFVLEKIRSGEYPVGGKIPSEIELAQMFSVSRITANKALKELSLMGVLERVRGRGSFVCKPQRMSTSSKAFVAAANLNVTSKRCHQLLQFRIIKPYPELCQKAPFPSSELFYEIILANKDGERDESLDFTYIPCSLVPDITPTLDYLCTHFVFDYLKSLPSIEPKFLKIFVNIPHYDFLDSASALLHQDSPMQIWNTDVYDADMNLLCATFTAYPNSSQDIPLFTFSL